MSGCLIVSRPYRWCCDASGVTRIFRSHSFELVGEDLMRPVRSCLV